MIQLRIISRTKDNKGNVYFTHVNHLANRYVITVLNVVKVNTLPESAKHCRETGDSYNQGTGGSPANQFVPFMYILQSIGDKHSIQTV